jgi:hypothetical protein
MDALQQELGRLNKMARLSAAVAHVDGIIELLSAAREQVAESYINPHTTRSQRYGS